MKSKYHKHYTEEQIQFLKDNVKGITVKELTERFNRTFNQNRTESSISNQKNKYGLKNGLVGGRFEKGQVSFNKGLKQTDYMTPEAIERTKATRFKKGDKPGNHRPVGSERITVDGYVEIKTKEPDVWELKHRVVWEKEKGLIPKGYVIIFADGNKQNLDLDNLILVSRKEHAVMNKRGLRYDNKETTELGVTLANLILKTGKVKRGD